MWVTELILFGVCLASWMFTAMSFIKPGGFSHCLSNILCHFLLSSHSGTPTICMLFRLMVSHRFFRLCTLFFNLFSFHFSVPCSPGCFLLFQSWFGKGRWRQEWFYFISIVMRLYRSPFLSHDAFLSSSESLLWLWRSQHAVHVLYWSHFEVSAGFLLT